MPLPDRLMIDPAMPQMIVGTDGHSVIFAATADCGSAIEELLPEMVRRYNAFPDLSDAIEEYLAVHDNPAQLDVVTAHCAAVKRMRNTRGDTLDA